MTAGAAPLDGPDWIARFSAYLELRIARELQPTFASGRTGRVSRNDPGRTARMPTQAQTATDQETLNQELRNRRAELFNFEPHEASGPGRALHQIQQDFALEEFDLFALVFCLVVDIEARFANACSVFASDPRTRLPDAALLTRLFHIDSPDFAAAARLRARLIDEGPLFRAGLIRRDGLHLRADERLHGRLFGDNSLPAPVAADWRLTRDPGGAIAQSGFSAELIARLKSAWRREVHPGLRGSIIWIEGAARPDRLLAARALAELNGKALLTVDLRSLAGSGGVSAGEIDARVRFLVREAILQNAALCIAHGLQRDESGACDESLAAVAWGAFLGCARDWRLQLILCDALSPESAAGAARQRIELAPPGESARCLAWRRALESLAEFPDEEAEPAARKLAESYRLSPALIPDVVESLAGAGEPLSLADLERAARARTRHGVGPFARRITARRTREDLVLPQSALTQIDEICNRVRQRGRVLEEWGFGRRASYGRGVTALFAGPPGVGKTLAAEAIASAAGLDLYRVDLAGVVSKYIGETEKNLARIFRETAETDAVLFFDEADALFGKRSEINDARDRYANIETSYLLQRIEDSEGVILLASNLRENIDPAFVRRLDHIVEFPYPDLDARERLWRNLLPPEIPQRAIDHAELARRLPLAGGSLRNIALSAAYLAAGNGCVLTMEHLLAGARREYAKLGKLWQEDRP